MKLKILDKVFEINHNENTLKEIFKHIDSTLEGSPLFLSHIKVDGVEVFEEYEHYIESRISNVSMIEVEVKSQKELIHDAVLSMEEYLERAIPEIRLLADEFYQGPGTESWNKFNQFLEGTQWIFQVINSIESVYRNSDLLQHWNEYSVISLKLQNQMEELEKAMKDSDMVLLGDLLNYEIIPLLESLSSEIDKTIDNEVIKDDLN